MGALQEFSGDVPKWTDADDRLRILLVISHGRHQDQRG